MRRLRLAPAILAIAAMLSFSPTAMAAENLSRVVTVEKDADLTDLLDRVEIQYLLEGVPPFKAPKPYKSERASVVLTHWLSVTGFHWRIKDGVLVIYRPGDPIERYLDASIRRVDIENQRMDSALASIFALTGINANTNPFVFFPGQSIYPAVSAHLRRATVRDSLIAILRQTDKSGLQAVVSHWYRGDRVKMEVMSRSWAAPPRRGTELLVSAYPGIPPWADDDVPPVTTLKVTPKAVPDSGGLRITPRTRISFEATDAAHDGIPAAGVNGTNYWIDVTSVSTFAVLSTNYTAPFSLPPGRHTIAFFSTDKAGNQEEPKSAVILVEDRGAR